jgi:hypothetical protein
MARVKISELPELTSGSLNTILVGDDNGSTYKIPLSVITASVVQMLSASADARLDVLEAFQTSIGSGSSNTSLNTFTSSYLTDSASFDERIIAATNEQDLSSLNTFTQSIDSRVDSLESWSSSLDTTFATDLQVSIVSSSVAATIGIISQNTGLVTTSSFNQYTSSQTELNNTFATTGSNDFFGSQRVNGYVSASYYRGSGRNLTDLTPTTNWNYDKEFSVKKTEQLTFSGDYILENTYLSVIGGDEEIEYSSNKSFKKEGSIFIGGNLLLKDSYIENDGLISVGGEVILIGNSQITGTGKII